MEVARNHEEAENRDHYYFSMVFVEGSECMAEPRSARAQTPHLASCEHTVLT